MKLAMHRAAIPFAVVVSSLLLLSADSRAELAAWDQAKVTALAKQLETTTGELFQAFRREPVPTAGSPNRKSHFQLRQNIRMIRRDARSLSRGLQQNEDREATEPIYQSLMQNVRSARDNARRVSASPGVQQPADAALEILNQLMPFYDANAQPLAPQRR